MDSKDSSRDIVDSLDDLEKDFNTVMANIVADDNLSKFSVQYKALLDAFVTSHNNNNELVEKCRALNAEIVQNSTKVNSVMNLSQDDQRTIAGLKFEFEKAWKMVEMSQEKEQKTHEIIEALKEEAKKLGKMAQESGAQSMLKDNSLETIQADIDALKNEIKMQKVQIETLTNDNNNWKQKISDFESQTSNAKDEIERTNEELNSLKQQAKEVEDEVNNVMDNVTKTKNMIRENNEVIEGFDDKYSTAQGNLEEVKRKKEDSREELRDIIEAKTQSLQRVSVAQKLLENRISAGNKIKKEMEAIEGEIKEKDEYIATFLGSTKEVVDEYDANEKELNHFIKERDEIKEDMVRTRNRMSQCRSEIFRLQHELIKLEGEVGFAKRSVSLGQHISGVLRSDVLKEKKNHEAAEGATAGVFSDIANIKVEKHGTGEKAQELLKEIEKHSAETSQFRSETMTSEIQKNSYDEERKEIEIKLNKTMGRIQRIDTLQKSLIEERDLTRRQLEAYKQEAKGIESENMIIINEIQNSKELIRQKDLECIQIHKQREEIREEIPDLEKQKAQQEVDLKDITVKISTKYNELVRSRYYKDVAESGLKELQINVNALGTGQIVHESRVNAKHEETSILRQKINALKWEISVEASQYNKIIEKVESLKEELTNLVRKKKALLNQSRHADALFKEYLQTEKQVLLLKGRTKALEDEMETPINVHRWRLLEGTNPEHLSLIKMTQSLRDTLMVKIATIQRLRDSLNKAKEESEKIIAKANKATKAEEEDKINYYTEVLQQKNEQLRVVRESLLERSSILGEGRESVSNVRSQLRDVKMDYFKVKQETNQIRSLSQMQNPVSVARESKPKFIGGGFVCAKPPTSLDDCVSAPETPSMSPMVRASHIIVPTKNHKSPAPVHNLLGKKKLRPLQPLN